MGWVGVAALIATACFFLYRYPPQCWTSDFSPPPQSESTSDRSPTTPVTGDVNMKNISNSLENEDENADECQTTPKASASTAPTLDVPTLSLNDNGDKATGAEKQSGQEEKTQNGSMKPPVNEPTTLMPPPPRQPQASSSSLMPPPPPPRLRNPQSQPQSSSSSLSPGLYPPRLSAGGSLRPPPSAAAAARAPPSSRLTSSNSLAPIQTLKPSSARKAVLEPGYSPLDWAALTSNPNNKLRGANLPPGFIRVTPSMLRAQNGRKGRDAWTSYQGKVYNITPYLPFHPGGKGELLRGAGKDSGKLFMEIHPWVNWDAMLGECLVGILVSENEAIAESSLDAMD